VTPLNPEDPNLSRSAKLNATEMALREAWDAGETDALDGGVPCAAVAERLGVAGSTAGGYLRDLVAEGRAERCDGLNPRTRDPRISFAPRDPDADTDTDDAPEIPRHPSEVDAE